MSRWIAVIVGLILSVQANGAAKSGNIEVYRWIDERGGIHFTDNYQNVPERYRPKATRDSFAEKSRPPSSARSESEGFIEAPVVVNYYKEGPSILVRGLLNWKLPVIFHLDTGATMTAITQEDARSLGIQYERAPLILTRLADGRRVPLPQVVLNSVRVGHAEVTNLEAMVSDIRLLGLNFLSQFRVTVASDRGQIIFSRHSAQPMEESESIRKEKRQTVQELEARLSQVKLAIQDLEKMIQQRESTILSLCEKRPEIEDQISHLRQQQPSAQRDALIEEGEERLRMICLSIERENVAIKHHKKDIEIHLGNIDYYHDLISRIK